MAMASAPVRIAILDDYQNVALQMADWSAIASRSEITVYSDHVSDSGQLVARLQPFDVICVMRERTPMTRAVLSQLPRLKLIASSGRRNASIDLVTAAEQGIEVAHTHYVSDPTIEFTWALILASCRHIASENASVRAGGWQTTLGMGLRGKTLGVLGLGSVGSEVAKIGHAFGMRVIAWSQNLTQAAAVTVGAHKVLKDEIFREADVLTIHLVLSDRTRGLVGAQELALMKSSARLINTSRGPIVDKNALIEALKSGVIAGAAIDVFDSEPLSADDPFRSLNNLLATPHIGYVSRELYQTFYVDTVCNISAWLAKQD